MSEKEQSFKDDLRFYLIGFAIALALTIIPFLVVVSGLVSFAASLGIICGFGLLQIVIHFRFFLHIDMSEQKREDLLLILFSTLLLVIMALGTIWIMGNLAERMM